MRITSMMQFNNMTRNINTNLERYSKYEEQMYSGRRISRVSDDPMGAIRAMQIRTELSQIENYESSIEMADAKLTAATTTLGSFDENLTRLKTLALQISNGSNNDENKATILAEIQEIKKGLVALGNTSAAGEYLFAGFNGTKAPFEYTGGVISYNGTDINTVFSTPALLSNARSEKVTYEINKSTTIDVTIPGVELFRDQETGANLLKIFDDIEAFANGTSKDTSFLDRIDDWSSSISTINSEVGAKQNRLEFISNVLKENKATLEDLKSSIEEADITETTISLANAKNVYETSLQMTAKMSKLTLLDFL